MWVWMVLRPWTQNKFDQQHSEFALAVFTELIIIAATLMIVKIFVERREEESRDPVYEAVFEEAYRIFGDIFRLIYSLMKDTFDRQNSVISYPKTPQSESIRLADCQPIVEEFFEESKFFPIVVEHKKYRKKVSNLYSDVDYFLQYYSAFLTSDVTRDKGSKMLVMFSHLRNFFNDLTQILEDPWSSLHSLQHHGSGNRGTVATEHTEVPEDGAGFLRVTFKKGGEVGNAFLCSIHGPDSNYNEGPVAEFRVDFLDDALELGNYYPSFVLDDFLESISDSRKRQSIEEKYYLGDQRTHGFKTMSELLKVICLERGSNEASADYIRHSGTDMTPVQFPNTLKKIHERSPDDDADSQNQMGILYRDATGGDWEDESAVEWFKLAAKKEHPDATFNLARMYEDGRGVSWDEVTALEKYRKASRLGHLIASYRAGLILEESASGVRDLSQAVEFYRKAAEGGYPLAQARLGTMYQEGIGISQDRNSAIAWYSKAAKPKPGSIPGLVKAQRKLGLLYMNAPHFPPDYLKAKEWFGLAADQGDAVARFHLGTMHRDGLGSDRDIAKALSHFEFAAMQGNVDAQFELGRIYLDGDSAKPDHAAALRWFTEAANGGKGAAHDELAQLLRDGLGVSHDRIQAIDAYRKAANTNSVNGQFELGIAHGLGIGVRANESKASKWFDRAKQHQANLVQNTKLDAEQGISRAQFRLGCMYLIGFGVTQNEVEAVSLFRGSAEQGDLDAIFVVGCMYGAGAGVEQNDSLKMDWWRQAAELHHESAQYRLGQVYIDGLDVERDHAIAARWIRRAAQRRYTPAQCLLGTMYEEGQGVEEDIVYAESWYKSAAELGDAQAQFRLGLLYEQGLNGKASDRDAAAWYQRAAEQGHPEAQCNLGLLYVQEGRGLDRNPVLALEWFRRAAEQEVLATTTRLPAARQSDRGGQVQRRYRGHRGQQGRRMTNPPYTRFDNSSPKVGTKAPPN